LITVSEAGAADLAPFPARTVIIDPLRPALPGLLGRHSATRTMTPPGSRLLIT
jgi:hypothetical protein